MRVGMPPLARALGLTAHPPSPFNPPPPPRSTVRYGATFHAVAAGSVLTFIIFLGVSQSGGVASPSTFLALAFALPLTLGAAALALLARRRRRDYAAAVRMGTWHEGIIVFPSGDVVIRLKGLFASTERTLEAGCVSRAEVDRAFAPHRLAWRAFLRVYYVQPSGKAAVYSVCETELADPPARVADFINAVKAGAGSGGGGGGGL